MFGYLPPPHFGPSTAYTALMRSEFAQRCQIHFINLRVARDIQDLEKFRWSKLARLAQFFAQELFLLVTHRFDFVCYPISFNRNAFLKDALLLGMARLRGVPTVLFAHGNGLPEFYDRSPRWLRRVIHATIDNAAAAIVLGDALRFNFEHHLPPERIAVVPLGIEDNPPLPPRHRTDDRPTVLFLSNLIPEKGVFVLLDAIPAIIRERPDARFVFAGRWWSEEVRLQAEQTIKATGIADHVTFTGLVVGDAKWLALVSADLLAFPTFYHYETFGFVLLEAMRAGLPVVTTARAAIPEIIRDGVNGLLVAEQDPGDLARKILQLLNDPKRRAQMSQANRERFASFYTNEHYGRRMLQVFQSLQASQP